MFCRRTAIWQRRPRQLPTWNVATPYTLPELIDIAQTNNPTTRNAWNDARDAALTAGIAESTFLAGRFSGHRSGLAEVP